MKNKTFWEKFNPKVEEWIKGKTLLGLWFGMFWRVFLISMLISLILMILD